MPPPISARARTAVAAISAPVRGMNPRAPLACPAGLEDFEGFAGACFDESALPVSALPGETLSGEGLFGETSSGEGLFGASWSFSPGLGAAGVGAGAGAESVGYFSGVSSEGSSGAASLKLTPSIFHSSFVIVSGWTIAWGAG